MSPPFVQNFAGDRSQPPRQINYRLMFADFTLPERLCAIEAKQALGDVSVRTLGWPHDTNCHIVSAAIVDNEFLYE
jgi:hypothetical protein